jgi:hypothetical protein
MSKTREIFESIKDLGGQAWDAGKPMFDHGRTELAAGILGQHQGHVMYMHSDKEVEQSMHGMEGHQHQQEDQEREM